jgi:hypothetical protein
MARTGEEIFDKMHPPVDSGKLAKAAGLQSEHDRAR